MTLADDMPTSHGKRVMARLDALSRFSSETGALTRLYLSDAHRHAADCVRGWMQEAGLDAGIDAAGNVVGRCDGTEPGAKRLILGSHIDTVRNAGRYDGMFGVVAAIEAVDTLRARGEALPFPLEIVAFGDEEGVRFPVTLTGSRALAGTLTPDWLNAADDEGVTLREALIHFGCDADAIMAVARDPQKTAAYVELHIEQGPVLEAENAPLGIVTGIAGATRATVSVAGMAGHSGTVPMAMRRDALAGAAEMVLAVEALAQETPDLVATVGRIEARPGAVNVIPGMAVFTLDVRSTADEIRETAIARLRQTFDAIAVRRGLSVTVSIAYEQSSALCDPALRQALALAVRQQQLPEIDLPSGAGHDGLAMASLCPTAMLFVRCRGGISHHPAESITVEDADIAVRVLIRFLENYISASE